MAILLHILNFEWKASYWASPSCLGLCFWLIVLHVTILSDSALKTLSWGYSIIQTWYLSFFSTNVHLGSIFLHIKARKLWRKKLATKQRNNLFFKIAKILHILRRFLHNTYFRFLHICLWRLLKFLHMWRNFQFPHNCRTKNAEISSHDSSFSTNNISDFSDKYQVWM